MPCNFPATGRRTPQGVITYYGHIQKAAGKIPPLPPNYKDIPLPCGKCTGCKLEYSRQWAVRLTHEKYQHERTSFVTLTYRDDALPGQRARTKSRTHEIQKHASLSKRDLQQFTKRLNQHARRTFGEGVKYYACGEYGETTHRPHYHIAIYGEDFGVDRVLWKHAKSGNKLYRSQTLARLWPHGDADIGELTFESAAYIARYIMKKITGTMAADHYRRQDELGADYWLTPEFNVMSRRPGLAKTWFLKYVKDVYPTDQVISRGKPAKPPRYYDKLLEQLAPYEHAVIKAAREAAPRNPEDQTPERLAAREIVTLARLKTTSRSLE